MVGTIAARLWGVTHVRRAIWITVALSSALVVLAVLFVAAVPLTSNTLRHRIVRTLSERLNSDVELGDLHLRVFPRLHADGVALRIREHGRTDGPPLIGVRNFTVEADLLGLLRKRVAHVRIDGLEINIPPDRDHLKQDTRAAPRKPDVDPSHIEDGVVVDVLDADGARLVIIPRKADKKPKVWDIHTLRMRNVGGAQAMPYEATLTNGVPPGEIFTSGRFGPWQPDAPGTTPLEGKFTFDRADLSVFKGIAGTLAARGTFGGALNRIDIHGETDTPDFVVNVGGHPFDLHAKYHTIVDGMNGDTRLERIDASFLNSSLVASGSVLDPPGHEHGRPVSLDVRMDHARIEDVMRMAVNTSQPPMVGGLTLTTKFFLPAEDRDVAERLRLDGRFALAGARFTNIDVQGKIDELSRRSRGEPERKDRVLSNFSGRFTLADGRLSLPDLTFGVPGATIRLAGGYALKPGTLDFHGTMLMDAKISETTTGFKSLLLKAVDPLFNRNGGGSAIPFMITGTRKDPSFALDYHRVFKRGNTP
ncbi:MAG: hypothetical protein DMG01_24570 [Acidobacteria bacterium]|nr:MAG: hypothetical protein DMG01_24570 [Acidobacteriota bacterium]